MHSYEALSLLVIFAATATMAVAAAAALGAAIMICWVSSCCMHGGILIHSYEALLLLLVLLRAVHSFLPRLATTNPFCKKKTIFFGEKEIILISYRKHINSTIHQSHNQWFRRLLLPVPDYFQAAVYIFLP
jgi:hypothetical protein